MDGVEPSTSRFWQRPLPSRRHRPARTQRADVREKTCLKKEPPGHNPIVWALDRQRPIAILFFLHVGFVYKRNSVGLIDDWITYKLHLLIKKRKEKSIISFTVRLTPVGSINTPLGRESSKKWIKRTWEKVGQLGVQGQRNHQRLRNKRKKWINKKSWSTKKSRANQRRKMGRSCWIWHTTSSSYASIKNKRGRRALRNRRLFFPSVNSRLYADRGKKKEKETCFSLVGRDMQSNGSHLAIQHFKKFYNSFWGFLISFYYCRSLA